MDLEMLLVEPSSTDGNICGGIAMSCPVSDYQMVKKMSARHVV